MNYNYNYENYQNIPGNYYYPVYFVTNNSNNINYQQQIFNEELFNYTNNSIEENETVNGSIIPNIEEISKEIKPHITNIVCHFNLGKNIKLDIKKIAYEGINVVFKDRNKGIKNVTMNVNKSIMCIHETGKITCKKATSEIQAKLDCNECINILKRLFKDSNGNSFHLIDFEIDNLCASCDIGYKVSLNKTKEECHNKGIRYNDPDNFPGISLFFESPKTTTIVFSSGKINFVGAKSEEDVQITFEKVKDLLKECKKD